MKDKAARHRRHVTRTGGGGPSGIIFSEADHKVMAICSMNFVDGNQTIRAELGFEEDTHMVTDTIDEEAQNEVHTSTMPTQPSSPVPIPVLRSTSAESSISPPQSPASRNPSPVETSSPAESPAPLRNPRRRMTVPMAQIAKESLQLQRESIALQKQLIALEVAAAAERAAAAVERAADRQELYRLLNLLINK